MNEPLEIKMGGGEGQEEMPVGIEEELELSRECRCDRGRNSNT